jgi:hypothetical protein
VHCGTSDVSTLKRCVSVYATGGPRHGWSRRSVHSPPVQAHAGVGAPSGATTGAAGAGAIGAAAAPRHTRRGWPVAARVAQASTPGKAWFRHTTCRARNTLSTRRMVIAFEHDCIAAVAVAWVRCDRFGEGAPSHTPTDIKDASARLAWHVQQERRPQAQDRSPWTRTLELR